jgi:polysaccharide deacetylase 2 family uncharacterized protein YibQ
MAPHRKNYRSNYNKKKKSSSKKIIFFFFLLFLVILLSGIVFMYYSIKNENRLKRNNDITRLNEEVRLALFNHSQGLDSLKEYKVYKDGSIIKVYYNLIVNEEIYDLLLKALKSNLSKNGYKVNQGDYILASKDNIQIKIDIFKKGLKKKSHETEKPLVREHIAKIAIILDDGGNNLELIKKITQISYPLTVSILPFTPYDKKTAELLRKAKKHVFLHLPLQPHGYPATDPGKGAILLNTPTDLIDIIINKDIERIGNINGVNNHMGSMFTENRDKTTLVLKSIRRYTDVFVDSRTSSKSTAYEVCKSVMDKCGYNSIFIDNDNNKKSILKEIDEAYKLAITKKNIILIGHVREATIEALEEALPEYEKKGIKFVFVDEVL